MTPTAESSFDIASNEHRNQVKNALIEMIKYHSKKCLEGYMLTECEEATVDPRTKEIPIYGFWLTIVLLSTEHMHIVMKTHFNFSTLKPILAKIFDNQNIEISQDMAESFMNEFSNLLGTKIKNTLLQIGIPTGMSLPLLTRGFDNYFFEENFRIINMQSESAINSDHYHLSDMWSYKADRTQFFYSVEVDIMSPDTFKTLVSLLAWNQDKNSDSSINQLEFL